MLFASGEGDRATSNSAFSILLYVEVETACTSLSHNVEEMAFIVHHYILRRLEYPANLSPAY